MRVVGLMRAECVSEWAVGTSGVVGVMACRRMGNGGFCVGELLMLLLLKQTVVPVILLPLCVHDGWSAGTLMKTITGCCLSRLKGAEGGKGQIWHAG